MKSRRECKCPCHSGGVVMHPVPCCDGPLGYIKRKPKAADATKAENKKPK